MYWTGVLGEKDLLGLRVGVFLMEEMRGCSRGDEFLGGGVKKYGVVGGRMTGGGIIDGRVTVGWAAVVPSCGCSSWIASRAGVWGGWRFDCLNLAAGVGVTGSAKVEGASALARPARVGVPLVLRRFETLVDSPETPGLGRRPRLLRVVRGVDA